MESFQWPEPDQLPDDIKPICHFNGIRLVGGGGGGDINHPSRNNHFGLVLIFCFFLPLDGYMIIKKLVLINLKGLCVVNIKIVNNHKIVVLDH